AHLVAAAADLCVRGHARAAHGTSVPRRPDGFGAGHQCGAAGGVICGISCPSSERQASRLLARRWRISHFPVEFRGLHWYARVELLISGLTHYFALFSMLRRKTG